MYRRELDEGSSLKCLKYKNESKHTLKVVNGQKIKYVVVEFKNPW